MSDDKKIDLPGDPDQAGERLAQAAKDATPTRRRKVEAPKSDDLPLGSPEQQLRASQEQAAANVKTTDAEGDGKDEKDDKSGDERGPHSPAQFDDDGWGDTPVQMRG